MKKLLCLFFLALLTSCETAQKPLQSTMFMTPDAKIQYYQEQINHYQFLIDQEKKKQARIK